MKEYRFSSVFVLIILPVLVLSAISIADTMEEPYIKIHYREMDVDDVILEQNIDNFTSIYLSGDTIIWYFVYGAEPYNYHNLTYEEEQILTQAFKTNITNVLNYIKNNNFIEDYNDFYPYNPLEFDLDWYDSIIQIDENWYLASYTREFTPHPIIDSFAILLIILTSIAFASIGFLTWKYKKTKSKKILAILIVNLIVGIFILYLTIIWIYSNTLIAP